MTILITGGAGFIGCNFARLWLNQHNEKLINLDKLTYAGNRLNFADFADSDNYEFVRADIGDSVLVADLLKRNCPRAIIHFAAESHVDRSIQGGEDFISTNINGSYNLLKHAHAYWQALPVSAQEQFRFLHVSTDEVYGSLNFNDSAFTESSRYCPSGLYSASKAASDHLAYAYFRTHGLPVIITHSSNNYGPYQFPEKLIPLMILNAITGKSLPVYAEGKNIRDWLYVEDNCRALLAVLERGRIGETYNIGGQCEISNIELVQKLCDLLDKARPLESRQSYRQQITFVEDRLGHDLRYALDVGKIKREIGWQANTNIQQGLVATVDWYLQNSEWLKQVHADSATGC